MTEFESKYVFWNFYHEVISRQRYVLSAGSQMFLEAVAASSKSRIDIVPVGFRFWRAQLGMILRPLGDVEIETPLPPHRMLPEPEKAMEGRANSKGIPCVYGATSQETAMSEVRPWIGSHVSLAELETTRNLRIVDCSKYHAEHQGEYAGFDDPPEKREKDIWISIDQAFARPVARGEDVADYAVTQILADLFKSRGMDGVKYKSTFGDDGYNIALFDLRAVFVRRRHLYRTTGVKFEFESQRWYVDDRLGPP